MTAKQKQPVSSEKRKPSDNDISHLTATTQNRENTAAENMSPQNVCRQLTRTVQFHLCILAHEHLLCATSRRVKRDERHVKRAKV